MRQIIRLFPETFRELDSLPGREQPTAINSLNNTYVIKERGKCL